jgi:hypothetical protein
MAVRRKPQTRRTVLTVLMERRVHLVAGCAVLEGFTASAAQPQPVRVAPHRMAGLIRLTTHLWVRLDLPVLLDCSAGMVPIPRFNRVAVPPVAASLRQTRLQMAVLELRYSGPFLSKSVVIT